MKYYIISVVLLLVLAYVHPLHAVDAQEKAKAQLSSYNRFCPLLARALENKDVESLIELVEPAFRGVVSNDVVEFKFRFDGIRGSRVFCTMMPRTTFYATSINSMIDSFIGKGAGADFVDLVPLCVVSIRDEGTAVPVVDRLCVNTLLHKDGSVGIIGRIPIGRYTDVSQVVEDFESLGKKQAELDRCAIYRSGSLSIMENELAWRLARDIKAALSNGNAAVALGEKLSPNCSVSDQINAIERLSAYSIKEVIPYGSDEQHARNTVHAREGDRRAYSMAVMAKEIPATEVGWIYVIVGRDFKFRITAVINTGGALGVLPYNGKKRHMGNANGSQGK